MTSQPTASISAPLTSFGALRDIVALAIPLSVGVVAAAGLQFSKAWLISYQSDQAVLTTLSLLQPYYLILLAFLETLAITNQVFSARSKNDWPKKGVRRASLLFLCLGSCVIALLFAMSLILKAKVTNGGGIFAPDVVDVLPLYVASLVPFFVFEVYNAALRGQGRVGLGIFALITLIAIDLGVTSTALFHFHWGFNAVLAGNAAGPLLAIPIALYGTYRETRGGDPLVSAEFLTRTKRLLFAVGAPIFLSTLAGFLSAAVIFPAMNRFDGEMAAAFLFIIRLRILFIVPAIAAGSAIAILANQNERRSAKFVYLVTGAPALAAFYAIATVLLVASAPTILDHMLPAQADILRVSTLKLLTLLIPTFFTIAMATMLQIILEQLERGLFVLIVTVLVESLTCVVVLTALGRGADLDQICMMLVGFSILSLLLLLGQFMVLLRLRRTEQGDGYAV